MQPTTMIEKTSKRYKRGMVIGLLMVVCGIGVAFIFAGIFAALKWEYDFLVIFPMLCFLVAVAGVFVFLSNLARGWWHHG
jgi:hypothetical protein